jgi:hypothetical protein
MAEQRRKEMGIRKVLGASVMQVAGMLSRDFLRLVALAIIIGSPIAWWLMHWWLQDYVYRMTMYRSDHTGDGDRSADCELAGFEDRDNQSGRGLAVGVVHANSFFPAGSTILFLQAPGYLLRMEAS